MQFLTEIDDFVGSAGGRATFQRTITAVDPRPIERPECRHFPKKINDSEGSAGGRAIFWRTATALDPRPIREGRMHALPWGNR